MKVLFCSQTQLSRELGASKVLIELAEEMGPLGWECEFLAPADLIPASSHNGDKPYHHYLYEHLREVAGRFDVVDYDHHHLPYPRRDFPAGTLLVARSVLLGHHFDRIAIPRDKNLRARIHHLLKDRGGAIKRRRDRHLPRLTVREADLVNVANHDDRLELVRCGTPEEKITVIPYGISRRRRALFDAISSEPPPQPKIAFVGTFDTRKGATDFPAIVEAVCAAMPGAGFRLVGTHKDEAGVLARFPKKWRGRIEVVPQYAADELPGLLASCSLGVFPSYIEGFGFGVLEMLAASVPVIAYNAPGPPMMLPPEHLVARGDAGAMSGKVIALLRDQDELMAARHEARRRSQKFCWRRIAQQTSEIYASQWQRRQVGVSA
jgi:glycosyltransferase involved in cell wall biosynthesis